MQQQKQPSYDFIGSIALLEMPKGYRGEKKFAKQILNSRPNIKTVAKKAGATGGKYRIRKIKYILGEKTSKTICRESGCNFVIDLNKAYYTPRFGSERLRISGQIKEGENILALFAGIGPYPIVIEKHCKNAGQIVSIELNPDAFEFMKQNILLNKCVKIIPLLGDVKYILGKRGDLKNWADRIIMPHPTEALKFLPSAIRCAKNGGIIHLYSFGKTKNSKDEIFEKAKKIAKKQKAKIRLLGWRVARPYSKDVEQAVLDLKVIKALQKT